MNEALEAIRTSSFAAILLDLELPDSTGLETLRAARAAAPSAAVLALSDSTDDELALAALREGADDFLSEHELSPRRVLFALERAQARLVEQANRDGLIVTDATGVIRHANDAALRLFRAAREKLVGESLLLSTGPDELTEVEVWNGTEVQTCEVRSVPFAWRGEAASLITVRDISERKRAQAAFYKQHEIFQAVLDNVGDGICVSDTEGRLTVVNPAAAKMIGLDSFGTAPEQRFQHFRFFYPDGLTLYPVDSLPLARARRGESTDAVEMLMVKTDGGESIAMSVTGRPLRDEEGKLSGGLVVFHDVTERIRLDTERAKVHAAQEASRLKSDFVAHMSHEIRTPLNGVLGLTYLALNSNAPEKQRKYLESIQRAGQDLLYIVNDILDFSKIEAGRLSLEEADFRLDEVIETVVALQSPKAAERGVGLAVEVDPRAPLHLRGDSTRLGQVLLNLVSNAIKFTKAGRVRLTVGVEPSKELRFSIEDTGIGLAPEQMESLFRPFFQADSSTHRKYGGTGLGLAICERLVHLMGGRIEATSTLGAGSTFTFTARIQAVPPKQWLFLGELPRVLVAGGSDEEREILCAMLENMQLPVRQEKTIAAAVARLEQSEQAYPLIFVHASEEELLPLLRAAQRFPGESKVTVIANQQDEAFLDRIADSGAHSALLSPYTAAHLTDTISILMGTGTFRRPRSTAQHPSLALQSSRNCLVLVVEDNVVNQHIAQELLELAGLQVEMANNGIEGVNRVLHAEPPVDLVLMDVQMPQMDGCEATQLIRRDPRWGNLPIVAMTAHVLEEERSRCRRAGMDDFIDKPVSPDSFFETLKRWLPVRVELPPEDGNESFPEIAGIDTRAGLKRLAGKVELYRKLLSDFAGGSERTAVALEEEAELGDRGQLGALLHRLRGVAANLGMGELAQLAGEADLSREVAELTLSIRQVGRRIEEALLDPVPASIERPAADVDFVREGIDRLVAMLQQSDGGSIDYFSQIVEPLRPFVSVQQLQTIERLLWAYDFPAALSHLREVQGSLGDAQPGRELSPATS